MFIMKKKFTSSPSPMNTCVTYKNLMSRRIKGILPSGYSMITLQKILMQTSTLRLKQIPSGRALDQRKDSCCTTFVTALQSSSRQQLELIWFSLEECGVNPPTMHYLAKLHQRLQTSNLASDLKDAEGRPFSLRS